MNCWIWVSTRSGLVEYNGMKGKHTDLCQGIPAGQQCGETSSVTTLIEITIIRPLFQVQHLHYTCGNSQEILVVLEGTLYVGFATSNTENHLFTKVRYPGDVFVLPVGLIHFPVLRSYLGKTNVDAFSSLSSQNPGMITIANAVLGSSPPTNYAVFTRHSNWTTYVVKHLR
ncbi:hypothetical protein DITRI_Ditri20bG0053300 [Diplodiscus trichospermus]